MTVRSWKEARQYVVNPSNPQSIYLLTNAPLNVTQTISFPTDGFDKVELQVVYTYAAATQIQVTPYFSLDGVNFAPYASTSIAIVGSTAQGTNYPYQDLYPVSASGVLPAGTYLVNSASYMRFVFTSTGGTGSDTITVTAIIGVGPSI